jgi:hypothetical protein
MHYHPRISLDRNIKFLYYQEEEEENVFFGGKDES